MSRPTLVISERSSRVGELLELLPLLFDELLDEPAAALFLEDELLLFEEADFLLGETLLFLPISERK
jgi:hypothetical protein